MEADTIKNDPKQLDTSDQESKSLSTIKQLKKKHKTLKLQASESTKQCRIQNNSKMQSNNQPKNAEHTTKEITQC